MNLIEHFINGKITKGSSKNTSKVFNPATGEQSAEVNLASKSDVNLVIEKDIVSILSFDQLKMVKSTIHYEKPISAPIKAGEKIPLTKINKAISRIKKMDNPSEKNKNYRNY